MKRLWSRVFNPYQWWYPWLLLAIICSTVILVGWGLSWYVVEGHAPGWVYTESVAIPTPTPEVCSGNTN